MASRDSFVIINRGLEERHSITGRVRRVIRSQITIDAQPQVVLMDTKALGAPIANAIADGLRAALKNISAVASPSTLLKRKYAATAFNTDRPWAKRRYGGGRIGMMAPNQTDRLFNDSGRFAQSIVANASKDNSWRVNVAANRLDDKTAGPGGARQIWERLIALVPEFENINLLFENNTVVRRKLEELSKLRLKFGKNELAKTVAQFQAFTATFLKGEG